MIAKGKRTALLNGKFSRAVLLALFFFSPGYIVFRFFPIIAGTRPIDFPFKVFFPGNLLAVQLLLAQEPFHEIILQVGNKDDMSADSRDGQLVAAVLDEYMRGFQERNPQLRVFSAHLHMDEATPHLHIGFVPFTTGSKRGLDTRVSLKQALAAQGFKGGTRGDTEWSQWVRSEKEQLAAVMERHGIEWEDKGIRDKHLSVMDYKKEQRAKEIAELEAVKAKKQGQVERQEQRLKELAPAVRNMEQLAAQFSDDPERILPEPGPLESAKSYREKKAKPLFAKIVKVLRSLYRAYVKLKGKYERLQGDYGRAREGNERLSDHLQEAKLENKALRGTVADFERVKRAFGPEEVERAVEDAKRREAQEREQKKAKRKFSRGRGNGYQEGAPRGALLIYACQQVLLLL